MAYKRFSWSSGDGKKNGFHWIVVTLVRGRLRVRAAIREPPCVGGCAINSLTHRGTKNPAGQVGDEYTVPEVEPNRKSRFVSTTKELRAMSTESSLSTHAISPDTTKNPPDDHSKGVFTHYSRADKVRRVGNELWGWWCNTMPEACQYSTGGIDGFIAWNTIQSSVIVQCSTAKIVYRVVCTGPIQARVK
jgi:hypothetical protein